jgi:hypothetical protein
MPGAKRNKVNNYLSFLLLCLPLFYLLLKFNASQVQNKSFSEKSNLTSFFISADPIQVGDIKLPDTNSTYLTEFSSVFNFTDYIFSKYIITVLKVFTHFTFKVTNIYFLTNFSKAP